VVACADPALLDRQPENETVSFSQQLTLTPGWLRVQIQYSLLDRRPENETVSFCQQHDIKILPFGTVAGGLLSSRYLGVPASECVPSLLFPLLVYRTYNCQMVHQRKSITVLTVICASVVG
jgi:aryl-alcohol dehydrogenase-like predicted oxidoreductase